MLSNSLTKHTTKFLHKVLTSIPIACDMSPVTININKNNETLKNTRGWPDNTYINEQNKNVQKICKKIKHNWWIINHFIDFNV